MPKTHLRITITVAVVLPGSRGGGGSLQNEHFAREVRAMDCINTMIALIALTISAVSFGLQIAAYIDTKINRR